MWFGSRDRGLTQHLRKEKTTYAPNGETVEQHSKLLVQFRPGQFPDWAMPLMKARWPEPKGLADNPINPKIAYGGVNTLLAQKEFGWSDEDRLVAERLLLEKGGGDIIYLEEPQVAEPWPNYARTAGGPKRGFPGKTTPQAVVEMVKITEVDPELVVLYEQQTSNRADVIAAVREYAADVDRQLISA